MAHPVRMKLDLPIPADLQNIHRKMKYAGRELHLVGGAVRDALMGKEPKDYDVATNAHPDEVIKILQKSPKLKLDLTGKRFGVVRVKTPENGEYEIATYREDVGKGKDTSVKFSTIENDVKRRDLTINALFYDMDSGEVVDYVGGIEDVKNGIIRSVGNPTERFSEDKIRILRAVRFAARIGGEIDPDTVEAIQSDEGIRVGEGKVESEQPISEEFKKGIKTANSGRYLELLFQLNIINQIFPGLILTPSNSSSNDVLIQIALLLRDNDPNDVHRMLLKSLRYSKDESNIIRFFMNFLTITPGQAPGLRGEFKRIQALSSGQVKAFGNEAGMSQKILNGFLKFILARPVGNARELMAKGITGPELGKALAKAESDMYQQLIGENLLREFINLCLSTRR